MQRCRQGLMILSRMTAVELSFDHYSGSNSVDLLSSPALELDLGRAEQAARGIHVRPSRAWELSRSEDQRIHHRCFWRSSIPRLRFRRIHFLTHLPRHHHTSTESWEGSRQSLPRTSCPPYPSCSCSCSYLACP